MYVCTQGRIQALRGPWTPSLRIFAVRVYKQLNLKKKEIIKQNDGDPSSLGAPGLQSILVHL